MKSSGARPSWFGVVVRKIMDGGANPPSFDLLCLTVPGEITTAINDGHMTAAIAYGEEQRDDFRAGQKFFIREVLDILQAQGFIGGDDSGYKWLYPLDGNWQVEVDGHSYRIFGQKERRLSIDRSMLGETDEEGISGSPGLFARGNAQQMEVQIIGVHGNILKETRKFQVHPLALAIPPMTERERENLRKSILLNGVKVPIVIFQKKVLDGRHRFYFASILKKPVQVVEFEGTEEEAKRHIVLLNLHRRHLTVTQQGLAAIQLFGEEARKETAEAQKKGVIKLNKTRSPLGTPLSPRGEENRGPRYEEIVMRKAQEAGMSDVTARGIKALRGIDKAPLTKERIERGKLSRLRDVKPAIEAELRKNRPQIKSETPVPPLEPAYERSVAVRLREILTGLREIADDENMPPGKNLEQIRERNREIDPMLRDMRRTLRRRGLDDI